MPDQYGSTEADSHLIPRMPNLQEVEHIRRKSYPEQEHCAISTRRQQYGATVLATSNFFVACCVSLQAPFFPKEAYEKGMSPSMYGLVFGVFHLTVLVLSIVFGRVIPQKIRSKLSVTLGLLITGISAVIFGVLDLVPGGLWFIWLAFTVRVLEAVGTACFHASSYLIIMEHFPDNVATYLGILETMFAFGVVCGPLLGGILYQVGGYTLPFAVFGVCITVCGLCSISIPSIRDECASRPKRSVLSFLKNHDILMDAVSICVACICTGFNQVTLQSHLRRFQLPATAEGAVFIITGAVYAITAPLWGKVCDLQVNVKTWTVVGFLIIAVDLLLIGPVPFFQFEPQLWIICVSLALLGIGIGGALISPFAGSLQKSVEKGLVSDLGTYGLLSSMFSSSASLGAFFGSSFGGIFLETIGYETGTLILLAVVAFVTAYSVGYLIMRRPRGDDAKSDDSSKGDDLNEADERQPLLQKKDLERKADDEIDEDDEEDESSESEKEDDKKK